MRGAELALTRPSWRVPRGRVPSLALLARASRDRGHTEPFRHSRGHCRASKRRCPLRDLLPAGVHPRIRHASQPQSDLDPTPHGPPGHLHMVGKVAGLGRSDAWCNEVGVRRLARVRRSPLPHAPCSLLHKEAIEDRHQAQTCPRKIAPSLNQPPASWRLFHTTANRQVGQVFSTSREMAQAADAPKVSARTGTDRYPQSTCG